VILVAALWWLRAQLVTEIGVPVRQAWALGLPCGMLLDVAMALLVVGTAISVGAVRPRLAHPGAVALSIILLVLTTANVAYFGYFDARLEPWVIATHLRDLIAIRGSVAVCSPRPHCLPVSSRFRSCFCSFLRSNRCDTARPCP